MCKAPKEDEFRGAESTGASKGLMAGANLFGIINAVLTCVVLGIVATRGGDKTTKNYAATDAGYSITQNPFAADYGANPCIDESGKATLRSDTASAAWSAPT